MYQKQDFNASEAEGAAPGGARRPLEFDGDAGSARSKWVAALLALMVIGWMASGYVLPAPPEQAAAPVQPVEAVAVAVRDSRAEEVTRIFTAEGQAQPDRRAAIRSETGGEVAEIVARKGDMLEAGAVVARLSTREQEARVTQAREAVARAQREFDNAQSLLDRGVATQDRVTDARSDLAAAEAQLTQAEEAAEAAVIRAPFSGRLDALSLDEGEFVAAGAEIGTMLDSDPLTVVIQVPQQALSRIEPGQVAQVEFITGETREGEVSYVSADAASETRTFEAEITVPNPDGALASGLSAQIRVPTGTMRAHFVSPAILSLGTDGTLGVKTVDAEDTVVFHPVAVERAQTDGVWVSGLPDEARLITVGQGFVSHGEKVAPSTETARLADVAEAEAPAGLESPQ
ncbi:efflux RND transporter periplasmic adaptor subunit [Limimaricola pyoseonensis]|uniref:Membrane fusion protein, multidrug efflux system n=1 Tax=Limimaricola pyoseonensis TaxID=521013 RepID=A0A1G7IXU7_9RHOB|nr:efflux RND transporter periplasmic adaptor subunit [Limimaricola pyoseonensis]SDF17562.1 membrane fusion protein, multidrug efflux system [Limimaricola pyoseonensis]